MSRHGRTQDDVLVAVEVVKKLSGRIILRVFPKDGPLLLQIAAACTQQAVEIMGPMPARAYSQSLNESLRAQGGLCGNG